MRTYSVTKQKAEIKKKNHTCCDFYKKKKSCSYWK